MVMMVMVVIDRRWGRRRGVVVPAAVMHHRGLLVVVIGWHVLHLDYPGGCRRRAGFINRGEQVAGVWDWPQQVGVGAGVQRRFGVQRHGVGRQCGRNGREGAYSANDAGNSLVHVALPVWPRAAEGGRTTAPDAA